MIFTDYRIIELLREAQAIAKTELNISNILQPGIIKELIIANILGHEVITNKDLPDAKDEFGNMYEYLSSINRKGVKTNKGSSFQVDRVTKHNLSRIIRNKSFYFAFFTDHLNIESIYEVQTSDVLEEVNRQLAKCKNDIAHINFLSKWVLSKGTLVHSVAVAS